VLIAARHLSYPGSENRGPQTTPLDLLLKPSRLTMSEDTVLLLDRQSSIRTMTKALAYLRVSGRGQIKGDGFPRQIAAINKFAATHGFRVVRTFKEEGVSGTTESLDRPAWSEMIATILANGVRTIIIEKLDRLARDYYIQEHILRDLKKRGITLVSTEEPDLDSDNPTRVMFRQIVGSIMQYEKTMLVAKLKAARDRKKAVNGKCEGATLYGSDPRHPQEPAIRDRILAMHKSGSSTRVIMDILNAEGVPTRRGNRWHPQQVVRITDRGLRN